MNIDDTRADATQDGVRLSNSAKTYDAFISYSHEAEGLFAPVLQRGMQRLAKPWNRRRALEVFLDESSLAVSPGLWPSVRLALDASRWLVLLASPQAAKSHWVGKEIEHWVSAKGTDRLLVVVTDGTFIWDDNRHDLSSRSTAANPALFGIFQAEPKYLDMTWAQRDTGITLRNARFRNDIATLVAAIREVPKEEIEGEDVRQERRTRRIVRAVIATLTVLVLTASVLAVVANILRGTADYQRGQADYQRGQAIDQRDVAVSGELATESELQGDTNPAVSRLLSIAAWDINRSNAARYAMLTAATLPEILVFNQVTAPVTSVAFSPDGKTVATGNSNGANLWDAATGNLTGDLSAASAGAIDAVAFSPDGGTLATGGADGTVRSWDVANHQPVGGPLTGHAGPVKAVAFSPDGEILATGNEDGTALLWDVATGRPVGGPLTGRGGPVNAVAFSPDGTTLATGSGDGTVRLWDVATGQPIGPGLAAAAGSVNAVAFSPGGTTLATGNDDGTVRLWDVATGKPDGRPLTGQAGPVTAVAFSPDGKMLASGGADGTVRLWDVATHQPDGNPLTGHTARVTAVAFSPNGKTLVSGSSDGTARLWDVAADRLSGTALTGYAGSVYAVAFSPDGTTLATANREGTVRLWDVATGKPDGRPLTGYAGPVTAVAFSPDGTTLASGGGNGTARLWDVATRQPIGLGFRAAVGSVTSLAFSPDGKTLASASGKTMPFSNADGSGGDGTVRLWDVATRQPIGGPLDGYTGPVNSLTFSPDGKKLVAGTDAAFGANDGGLWFWNVATQQLATPGGFAGYTRPVTSVAFSPNRKVLAAGSDDGAVYLWDLSNGSPIGNPLIGQTGPVSSVAFSKDGEVLAAGGQDGTVRLWDIASRQQIGAPLSGDTGPVTSVVFSPDGKVLATGSTDGTARLWDVSYLVNVVQHLCTSAGRTLTRGEWAQYVPSGLAYQQLCHVALPVVIPKAGPPLGRFAGIFIHGVGFGQVRPSEVFNGGDPTGLVSHIVWKSWGGPQAIGTGIAEYVGPNQSVAQGAEEPARIVAFNLGPCEGTLMYQAVEWYFPQHRQTFNPNTYENICTGTYSQSP